MKKRLIKNVSVLLCAAMLVGSLGYGAAAEPQESEIFEEQGDETSSETSGVSTEPEKGAEAESKDTGDLSDEDGIVETGEEGKKTLDTSEETGEPNEKGDEVKSVEDVVTGDESGENSDSTEEAEGAEGAMTMKLMSGARPMLFKSNRTAPEGYYYSVDPNDPYVYKEDELDNEKSFYYTGDFREPTFYAFRTYSRYSLENLNERDSKSDYYIGELITDASTGETCVSLLEPKADGSPYELGDFDPSDYERYGIVALTEQEVKERRFNIATNQWDYSYYEYLSTETCTLDKCTIEYDLFDAYDKNGIYLGKAMGKVIPYLWSYRNVKVLRYFTFSGFIADEFLADMEAMDVNEFAAKHHSVLEKYVKTSVDPTEYGYESLNDEYCAKELPGETLTLYGEDYKITFSKVYNVIKKADLLAPGVVVPAVKIDDEGDFENVYGYVSVSSLKGKLFPQLPAILALLKASYG